TFSVHVAWPRPVGQRMIGSGLVAALRHGVENSINSHDFFTAPAIGRICVEDVTSVVLVENASARKVLDISRPIRSLPKIVMRAPRGDVLRPERDVEVIVEIAVERRDPQEFPSHSFANGLDFFDRSASDDREGYVVVFKVR